jgi:hypothetical protein
MPDTTATTITIYELQRRRGNKFAAVLCDSREEVLESVSKFLDLPTNGDAEELSMKIITTTMDRDVYNALPDWNGKGKS